jgi:hypothetical protein
MRRREFIAGLGSTAPDGLSFADALTGWTPFLISLFSVIDVHLIREG